MSEYDEPEPAIRFYDQGMYLVEHQGSFDLLTSRWHTVRDFQASGQRPGFVPVRTCVGAPRFMPSKGIPFVTELAPWGLLKLEDPSEFAERYLARLEKHGVEKIRARFAEIHSDYPVPLVLLCYEDVLAGELCHRRLFAEWWETKTGQAVPEAEELPVFTDALAGPENR